MPFELDKFEDATLSEDYLTYLVERQWTDSHARHSRLWSYFRNPFVPTTGAISGAWNINSRPYVQAQEMGLPARITGLTYGVKGQQPVTDVQRKEVVIENDIAWRLHTMVDYLFGKNVTVRSLADDKGKAKLIDRVIAGGVMPPMEHYILYF